MKKFLTVFIALLSLQTGQASAALNSFDWSIGSGDGLVTRDTDSGLDWLDVTLTVNQTYDQVRTGEWYQQGFRHATASELRLLFVHAGTPDDNFDTAITHPNETRALVNLLGMTFNSPGSRESTYGFVGTDFFGNDITLNNHPIGVRFDALLGKIDWLSSGDTTLGEAHFTGGQPFSDQADKGYGSFLVRTTDTPVPLPSSIWLCSSVLPLLLARRKRRD